jgi:hypothetical protein
MWISSFIADMRKAVADDPATAQAVFAAMGALVSVADAETRTRAVSVTGQEPPAPAGLGEPRSRWLRRARTRPALAGSGVSSPAAGSTRLSQAPLSQTPLPQAPLSQTPPESAGARLWP